MNDGLSFPIFSGKIIGWELIFLVLIKSTFSNTYTYIEVYIYVNLGLYFFQEKDLI